MNIIPYPHFEYQRYSIVSTYDDQYSQYDQSITTIMSGNFSSHLTINDNKPSNYLVLGLSYYLGLQIGIIMDIEPKVLYGDPITSARIDPLRSPELHFLS